MDKEIVGHKRLSLIEPVESRSGAGRETSFVTEAITCNFDDHPMTANFGLANV